MEKQIKNISDEEIMYITSSGYSTGCGYTLNFVLGCYEEKRRRRLVAMKVFPNAYEGL
jgi:hypothetical protein